jgi:hypothetical protein
MINPACKREVTTAGSEPISGRWQQQATKVVFAPVDNPALLLAVTSGNSSLLVIVPFLSKLAETTQRIG